MSTIAPARHADRPQGDDGRHRPAGVERLSGLARFARWVWRNPWIVLCGWLLLVALSLLTALGGVLGTPLASRLTAGELIVPGEGLDGQNLIARTSDDGPIVLLLVTDPDFRSKIVGSNARDSAIRFSSPVTDREFDRVRRELRAIPEVKSVGDPFQNSRNVYDAASAPYISDDQQHLLMAVTLEKGLPTEEREQALDRVVSELRSVEPNLSTGSTAQVGGIEQLKTEVIHQMERDLRTGEVIAFPLSLAIMVVVFSGFLAAGLPLLGAIVTVVTAVLLLLGFSYAIDLDPVVVNIVTVLGLGLCIDYGLLLVSRFREEVREAVQDRRMASGADREAAMCRAMASAGRTILFSGLTVAIALVGLLFFRTPLLQAIGAAGISTVIVAVLIALTLIPIMIRFSGTKVLRPGAVRLVPGVRGLMSGLGEVPPEEGAFSRLARLVQRFPAIATLCVLGALFVASMPVLHLHIVSSDVAMLPKNSEQRELFDTLQSDFQYAAPPPLTVVASTTKDNVGPLVEQLRKLPNVYQVDPPKEQANDSRVVTVIGLRVESQSGSGAMASTIRQAGQLEPGYELWVTGPPVALVDYVADLKNRGPVAIGVVILATFVLLFLMTGSIMVPIKALLMNVISLSASLGILVWGFQDANLEGLLSFSSVGGIETFMPPIVIAFGFGLAMDYEVFLLARIAEARHQGASNDEAVVIGLQRSGRIITSAALILIVVFLGLVMGQLLMVKEMGVALAVSVAVDATLVRMLLVPATMTLLGEWNWWAPPMLRRLHGRFGLRES